MAKSIGLLDFSSECATRNPDSRKNTCTACSPEVNPVIAVIGSLSRWPLTNHRLCETSTISAIAKRDYPVIQAGVVVFAFFVVLVNLLIDLAYIVVDPRIRVK